MGRGPSGAISWARPWRSRSVKAEGYAKRRQPLGDWTIEIETYQLGDVFYCTINNVDPGARFARAEGPTR